MSDQALKTAQTRLAHTVAEITAIGEEIRQLEAKRERLRPDLDRLNAFIATWYEMAGIQMPESAEQKEPSATEPARKPKNPDRIDVALKCVEYIRQAGRPLMRSDLFKRLAEDGIIIQGKDPEMVLSTMLWRTKDVIRRLGGGGYWPKGDSIPLQSVDEFQDLLATNGGNDPTTAEPESDAD